MVLATGTFFFFQTFADSSLSWQAFTAAFEGKNTGALVFRGSLKLLPLQHLVVRVETQFFLCDYLV